MRMSMSPVRLYAVTQDCRRYQAQAHRDPRSQQHSRTPVVHGPNASCMVCTSLTGVAAIKTHQREHIVPNLRSLRSPTTRKLSQSIRVFYSSCVWCLPCVFARFLATGVFCCVRKRNRLFLLRKCSHVRAPTGPTECTTIGPHSLTRTPSVADAESHSRYHTAL